MSSKAIRSLFMRRCAAGGAVLSAGVLLLTACSGGTGDAGSEGGSAATGSGGTCDVAPDYPNGPIELVVPFAAGGGTDSVARLIGEQLGEALDTQVNVVNRTGGGGVVGHQAIATASTDGNTLGLVTAELAMLHHRGLTDVSPEGVTAVSQINADAAAVTVSSDSDFESVSDLVDEARKNPGKLTASGTANAGIWHVAIAGMLLEEGVDADAIRWVPSEGAAPALQEVVAGGVDISSASLAENQAMLDSGRVKALGVMSGEPVSGFEDVPTLADQGIDYEMGTWRGIAGPAGLDENIVAELDCHLKEIVESEKFTSYMNDSGLGVVYRNHEEFSQFLADEDEAKGTIIREAGLTG